MRNLFGSFYRLFNNLVKDQATVFTGRSYIDPFANLLKLTFTHLINDIEKFGSDLVSCHGY